MGFDVHFLLFQWTVYRMSSAVALDSATNEARLEEIRNIADNTITDGICFAHGDFFSFAETSKVIPVVIHYENLPMQLTEIFELYKFS